MKKVTALLFYSEMNENNESWYNFRRFSIVENNGYLHDLVVPDEPAPYHYVNVAEMIKSANYILKEHNFYVPKIETISNLPLSGILCIEIPPECFPHLERFFIY